MTYFSRKLLIEKYMLLSFHHITDCELQLLDLNSRQVDLNICSRLVAGMIKQTKSNP